MKMKALVVEDEPLAQKTLCAQLAKYYPDMDILAVTDSVQETVAWLRTPGHDVDIIFMDVELLDGNCFEIFRQVSVTASVIMTTAYDKYAVKAFEAGSVDYLLKPIKDNALVRAVSRCSTTAGAAFDPSPILEAMKAFSGENKTGSPAYRKRLLVRLGQEIIPVSISDIAYFYVEGKSKYLVKKDGTRYFLDEPMDVILDSLDPRDFFRISRNYVVAFASVLTVKRLSGGRLQVVLSCAPDVEMIVSRARVSDFIDWLS